MSTKKSFARNILSELLRKEKSDVVRKSVSGAQKNYPRITSSVVPPTPVSELDELRLKYNSLREENVLKLADAEKNFDARLAAEIEKISLYEVSERENIASEELLRYTSMLDERRATYARDYESYQKKVLKDMEWKYCRRSFIPDCNCKKCYRKKMGIPNPPRKKMEKKKSDASGEKKSAASVPAKSAEPNKTPVKNNEPEKKTGREYLRNLSNSKIRRTNSGEVERDRHRKH